MQRVDGLFVDFGRVTVMDKHKPVILTTYVYPKKGDDHIEISQSFASLTEAGKAVSKINASYGSICSKYPGSQLDLGSAVIDVSNIAYITHVVADN